MKPGELAYLSPVEGFPYEFYQPGTRYASTSVATDGGSFILVDAGVSGATRAVEGNHVRFAISMRQPLKSWCNIQFSYVLHEFDVTKTLLDRPMTSCIPLDAIDNGPGSISCPTIGGVTLRGVSCAQASYCVTHSCDCSRVSFDNKSPPHGCTVDASGDGAFDLTLNGSVLTGSVSFPLGRVVRALDLTRSQP